MKGQSSILLYLSTNEKGIASLKDRAVLEEFLRLHPNSDFILKVEQVTGKATNKLRAYYYAGIVPRAVEALRESGIRVTANEAHIYLKMNCPLLYKTVTHQEGNVLKSFSVLKSLSELTPEEFASYIDFCKQFLAENLNTYIE